MEKWQIIASVIIAIFTSTGFWSWLSQRKASNKDILNEVKALGQRVEKVESKVEQISDDVAKTTAETCRVRLLRFNGELLRDVKHTEEEFVQTLGDIDQYEEYCRTHPDYKNSRSVMAIGNIKRCYDNCQQNHDFL